MRWILFESLYYIVLLILYYKKKAFDVKNMYFNYKTSTKKKTKKITCRSIIGFKKMLKSINICILLSKQPWGVVKIILFILYFSGQTIVLSLFICVYVYMCVHVCTCLLFFFCFLSHTFSSSALQQKHRTVPMGTGLRYECKAFVFVKGPQFFSTFL